MWCFYFDEFLHFLKNHFLKNLILIKIKGIEANYWYVYNKNSFKTLVI